MILTQTHSELRVILGKARTNGMSIGFVPTMGALHPGHISLINKAKQENDLVISSIFVNPTQFNNPNDLINYPRTPEADYKALEKAGCDVIFSPSVKEMYPDQSMLEMDFGSLERVMEGVYRPGHFKGVATIVSRFFQLVQPTRAYFGEKDFQQLAVIRELNKRMKAGIEIVGCATIRDADGVAMSSRNIHLTPAERKAAPVIYKSLLFSAEAIKSLNPIEVRQKAIQLIETTSTFKVQYLEYVDSTTLEPIFKWDPDRDQRACIAVTTSKTRLIDNIAI